MPLYTYVKLRDLYVIKILNNILYFLLIVKYTPLSKFQRNNS